VGSRLPVLAAQLIALAIALGPRSAAAETAPELLKQGIDAYKAGKYEDAIKLIGKSYALEPTSESLFALAQAERLAGKCDLAVPHYRKLIETSTELATARAVQNNLALCVKDEPKSPPAAEPDPVVTAPAQDEPKVVVREVSRTDVVATSMVAGGALATGAAIGLFLSSRSTLDAAADAGTLEGHDRLEDRGRRDRTLSFIAAGLGAGMIGYAVVRWTILKPARREIAIAPTTGGTMLFVSSRW
jgi:tetratricopeptide (TPR) repeat protein